MANQKSVALQYFTLMTRKPSNVTCERGIKLPRWNNMYAKIISKAYTNHNPPPKKKKNTKLSTIVLDYLWFQGFYDKIQ